MTTERLPTKEDLAAVAAGAQRVAIALRVWAHELTKKLDGGFAVLARELREQNRKFREANAKRKT